MQRTAITVGRARDEVTRLWATPGYRTEYIDQHGATVAFKDVGPQPPSDWVTTTLPQVDVEAVAPAMFANVWSFHIGIGLR